MIRNLTQMMFRDFGSILPDREQKGKPAEKVKVLNLTAGEAAVFRAVSETWIGSAGGTAVLSVSRDGGRFVHFYLDQRVCVDPGVLFYLTPFQGEARALITCREEPEEAGTRPGDTHRIERWTRVEGLYTFFYQEKEPGFLFSGESHPMPELIYVDRGSLHSVADGEDLLLKQGDMVIYTPNQWHMQYSDVDVAPRYVSITFDLQGNGLKSLENQKITASPRVAELLRQMLRELDRVDSYSYDMILAQLNALLLELLREADRPAEQKIQASNAVHGENEIIRRVQQYVSTHIREKLSVPSVARQVDVSPSYLTALFHKHLQISPGEYIRRIKLQESKQMIRENHMNFTEIAAALQYSTVHHFSRQFKEKFGITPTEYARSVR